MTDEERKQLIARAREAYGSDDIEIDEGATIAESDGGCFVAAWVWIPSASACDDPACHDSTCDGGHDDHGSGNEP